MSKQILTTQHAGVPQGAPFIIDSFKFGETVDYAKFDIAEDRIIDWPMVYILANQESAYVGQTTSVLSRMAQHAANEEKRDFDTVNVIYNEEFNASVITDYEHRLISLMAADKRYRLTNKNEGMTRSNYFSKEAYGEMFDSLWGELRKMELAEHTIAEIEESEVFKYSPYKSLTADQKVALDQIMAAIEAGLDSAKPIVVEGMPGTGKTVLAIFLLKMLKDKPEFKDMNIRLIEPVTSLRNTLRKTLSCVSGMDGSDVIGVQDLVKDNFGFRGADKKSFDIALIDESHRLKRRVNLATQFGNFDKVCKKLGLPTTCTQVDWILNQVKLPVFFYDPLQNVGPSCVGSVAVGQSLGLAVKNPIRLDSQMRVKGGKAYLNYVFAILNSQVASAQAFPGYDFVMHDSLADFKQSFDETLAEHSLTRMMAGYAWKWKTHKNLDPGAFDIEADGVRLRWNCTYDNWVGRGMENPQVAHEVGCIHSTQGYDLSYAYVIIGNDIVLDPDTGMLVANKNSYYDTNGKNTATQEELTQYIKNIYYVLLTRGIYGTHIYVVNPELRKYFSQFVLKAD